MRSFALIVALLLVPAIAAADPEEPKKERHGLFGGFGLHGGNISCKGDCGDSFRKAGGFDGHIGWMVNDKLGVMGEVWAMTSKEDNVSISYVTTTVNVRYSFLPILWVQAGLGSGHAVVSVFGISGQGDDVPVGALAVGLELVKGKNWALDVEAKVAQGSNTDSGGDNVSTGRMASLGAGFTFFSSR